MSNPGESLHGLEVEIEVELAIAESSREEVTDTPPTEWLSDPTEEERYEIGLHGLLDAVKAVEDGTGRPFASRRTGRPPSRPPTPPQRNHQEFVHRLEYAFVRVSHVRLLVRRRPAVRAGDHEDRAGHLPEQVGAEPLAVLVRFRMGTSIPKWTVPAGSM
ncbi:hypothetical protein [Amycolatopsis sp. NPDC021455]|uniref:hypothetical protein n=1 Tax=Amycolatopsis sp. NPDC021455 TaxID=3154901 RepID=UPI00340B471C